MQDFRELRVWEKAHLLTLASYRATRNVPDDERFGLTSQMRRAAASIGANIAEGCGRETRPDFVRFLQNAAGSASELEYHVFLARDLGYLSEEDCSRLTADICEVKRMLTGFIQRLKRTAA